MRLGSILMSLCAFGMAIVAGMLSKTWLEQQRHVSAPVVVERPMATNKVVVATQQLRFGQEIAPSYLKEIDWPAGNVPAGAFTSVAELLKAGERRVVLSAIEINEPIMKYKITGPGQRASLSSLIEPGMKAVTIRVNDVFGVAGFVLPGDRVDVLLTKTQAPAAGQSQKDGTAPKSYTDVLLQHVRVLGIDQLADDRSEKPSVAKAVTLELTTEDTQKVTLAGTMGNLSLALRPAGSTKVAQATRITTSEIDGEIARVVPSAAGDEPIVEHNRNVVIMRDVRRSSYTVPFDRIAR